MHTLEHLYVEELRDAYNAEKQILQALPKMAQAASSEDLQTAFNDHLKQTKQHVERLEKIFKSMGQSAAGKKCEGMEGIIREANHLLEDQEGDGDVIDAALIAAAQKAEHYEIATYGTLRSFAQHLGEEDAASLLQETLEEEGETDQRLTQLALAGINQEASEAEDEDTIQ